MFDPTRDDIMAILREYPFFSEADEFDIESAIYWFANDYHSGQWSNLYSILSTSEYRPGAIESGLEPETIASDLYYTLVEAAI